MEKGIFISPFVDRGFKILFGQENSKELLIDLLNDLLEGERHIEDLEYMNNELPPETADRRTALFDLRCKDKDGSIFLVEMQNCNVKCFYYIVINPSNKKSYATITILNSFMLLLCLYK